MENLNGIQAREYNRAQATALYLSQETKVYNLYEPFADEVALFSTNNKQLLALVPAKDVNGGSITVGKGVLKEMIATLGNTICTRTAAYARKTGDIDLEAAIYHRTSEIKQLKDADMLGFVTSLVGNVMPLLKDEVFQKYAVTQAILDTITNAGQDFNDSIGKADIVDGSSSFASRTINSILKNIRENMVQFNLLLNFFDEKYPAFVAGFTRASTVINTGIHHSGIEGVIKNMSTGEFVKGVTITGEGQNKVVVTNANGAYRLIKLKTGSMKITISAPGYDSQTITIKIIRGKILELNFELRAQAINLITA